MLRRLHSRIIGMGSVCGMTRASPPAEVFLKTLPPPLEVDPARFAQFKTEEEDRASSIARGRSGRRMPVEKAPEPFFHFVGGSAGHKHVVLLLSNGNLVTFGDNAYGQTGAPLTSKHENEMSSTFSVRNRIDDARAPLYIDLGDTLTGSSIPLSCADVACGSNFSFVFLKNSRRVVAFGNNHVGQLGLGHKNQVDAMRGFETWNPLASWWPDTSSGVASFTCGFNHSVVELTSGSLYAFGSNTWGELGIGCTTSPMFPTRITYFDEKKIRIKKVAAGNSFTLFLSHEGRVFGCGATNEGQLPRNTFEPVPIPVGRHYIRNPDGSGASSSQPPDPTKLIRIKDIACVGSLAVFLTSRNEILIQGGLRDYGVSVHYPRLRILQQDIAWSEFGKKLGYIVSKIPQIVQLIPGPQTLLFKYENGCIGGLGSNAEGELYCRLKRVQGRNVNVAPSCSFVDVFPVLTPITQTDCEAHYRPFYLMGKGFTLVVDDGTVYPLREEGMPIELPQSAQGQRARTS